MRPFPTSSAGWLVATLLVVSACGLLGEEAPPGEGPPPALVEVAETRSGALLDTWTVLGDVEALGWAQLAAGAAGEVHTVSVREGARVEHGQLLLEVDPALASARWASAKATADATRVQLEQARRDLARMQKVDPSVLSASEVDRQGTSVATLEAQLASQDAAARQAAVELERHRVRAPFDGVVAGRHVDPGDWVTPGQAVLDVVSAEGVEIHVHAPPALARQVRVGDEVTVHASPGVTAVVAGVVPALDPVQRTALLRIVPRDGVGDLLPGLPVDVDFKVQRADEDAVLVPRDALILGPVDDKIALVVDDAAVLLQVEVLATSGEVALVKGDGLEPGQRVVVRGNERLAPGQAVNVADTRGWTAAD